MTEASGLWFAPAPSISSRQDGSEASGDRARWTDTKLWTDDLRGMGGVAVGTTQTDTAATTAPAKPKNSRSGTSQTTG